MSNCIDIRVWNLSPESVNRLGGVTSASLDITNPETIRLTKSVEALSNANKLQTAGVLPFSVPSTTTNDAIFISFLTPLTVDNRKEYYDVSVNIAGHPLEFNRIVVVGTPKKSGDEWSLEFRRSPDHWIELSQDYNINEIDFGVFEFTQANILLNWQNDIWKGAAGQVPYHFPVLDYGAWCDRTIPIPDSTNIYIKAIANEDLRPLVSLPFALKQGFCDIGWTIDGVIFDSDWFSALWMYALSKTYYEAAERLEVNVVSVLNLSASAMQTIRFGEIDTGVTTSQQLTSGTGLGLSYYGGIKNTLNISYKYKIELIADISNSGANVSQVFNVVEISEQFDGEPTGEVISEDVVIDIASGQTKSVYVILEFTLKPGQCGAIYLPGVFSTSLTMLKGARVIAYPDDKSLFTGQSVTIKNAIRDDVNLMDLFKAVCHLCRLNPYTDLITKTVTLYPKKQADVYGFTVPGFIRDEEANIDISELVIDDSIDVKPIRNNQQRYTEVKFKDSTDSYIDSLQLLQQAHSRKILNGLTLPDGITTIENILFEPTLETSENGGLATGSSNRQPRLRLPRLWDNTEGNRSFDIAPRILFSFGKVKQKNPTPINAVSTYSSFFFNTVPNGLNVGLVQEFGYATQLRTWAVEPTPAIDGNVVFGTQQEDLFTNFYLSITQELKGGFDIDALMLMKMSDYVNVDFRSIYRFMYRGRPISAVMTKIRDAALCSGLPTPVTFFVDPVETECCDLPCGCQFSTCEYYQDLGQFVRQSTLDSLTISYFTVDGINVIGSTPIPLGILKIVNINGRPFITNLVDALNSVGAPYMSFSYGTRMSAAKGARFFTVKRPKCTPFEIIVSFGVDEVYHYSDTIQEEQWFAGSWGPLGYGAESYNEPENCIITTEY